MTIDTEGERMLFLNAHQVPSARFGDAVVVTSRHLPDHTGLCNDSLLLLNLLRESV
jgi:hypothetical protein